MECLFCKIIDGDIKSEKMYEDEVCYAFKDINPVAPIHVLFIPKTHISGIDTITEEDSKVIANIFSAIKHVAIELGLNNGYRVVTNVGEEGGQSVRHLHFHLIGGRKLTWQF